MKISIPMHLMLAFAIIWTLGEVCQSTYRDNLLFSICMTIGYAIYLGAPQLALKKLKQLRA